MAKYMTKQRSILLDYLSSHIDETLSAKQIAKDLEENNISASAVYRNMFSLENEGLVKRISKPGYIESFFQYKDNESCKESIHLSCKRCGKTFHMKNSGATKLISSIEENEGFSIDNNDTILYGICKDCKS